MSVEEAGGPPGPEQMSEEEMRARLAEELKKVQVHDVLLQTVVTLINVGGQRLGVGDPEARDLDQARLAIESVRALMPLLEERAPGELSPLRDALAQLQMIYAREAGGGGAGGGGAEGEAGEQPPPGPSEPQQAPGQKGSAGRQSGTGGLWVPPGSQT